MSFLGNAKRAFTGRDYDDDREYDEEYEDYEDEYEDEKPRRGIFSLFSRKRDDDYEDEYEEEEQPAARRSTSYSSGYRDQRSTAYSGTSSSYRSSSQRQLKSGSTFLPKTGGTELSILSPTSFDDSSKIVREVKENHITIFDMSGVAAVEEARRIVDYISGAAEGMDCQFARICPSVFCLAPKGVVLNNKRPRY